MKSHEVTVKTENGVRTFTQAEVEKIATYLLEGIPTDRVAETFGVGGRGGNYTIFYIASKGAGLCRSRYQGDDLWSTHDWHYGNQLTEQDRQRLVRKTLHYQNASEAAAEMRLDAQIASRIVKEEGLIYNPSGSRDNKWARIEDKTKAARMAKVSASPGQAEAVCKFLLEGVSTRNVAKRLNKSDTWVWGVAIANGVMFDKESRKWKRKECDVSTNEIRNLTTEEYEALITSERGRTNTNGHTPVEADTSEDSDIITAVKLLDMAEAQRSKDIAEIERLELALADVRGQNERIAASHAKELQAAESRITRLETEIRRLDDALKVEISKNVRAEERGLLRQSIDRLSKVL